jgi:light-regulated signal transduction histidine kinase (bacteriophytochrome)
MDITRRWEAERALADRVAALERSNDDLTAFGRIVAHDLKEPLRGMGAYASFVLEDAPDLSPDLRGKLEKIVRLAKRTATALDGLLHFAQVGMQAMEPEPVNLEELASEVLDSFGPQFEAAGAVGRVVSPLPSVRCDRHLVAEAMANLVGNALKYNDKPQKTVEIGALPSGFYVRDNGIGMAPAARSRVFDVFTRLHAKDEFGGGEGLGLSIVKRVAERHHGAVWIESSLGQGSTFFVTLGDAEGGGRPRTPPHERGGGGGQEEWGPKRN